MCDWDWENQTFRNITKSGKICYGRLLSILPVFLMGYLILYPASIIDNPILSLPNRNIYLAVIFQAWVLLCALIEIIYIFKKYKIALRKSNLKARYLKNVLLRVLLFSAICDGIAVYYLFFHV